nr:MAG TPA: hypothetical protein [Caudoviricetes sp.]
MTMVTVPMAVLLGAAIGMLASGVVVAVANDDIVTYLVTTVISIQLFVFVFCGLEVMTK